MYTLNNVKVVYGRDSNKVEALKNINLKINEREIISITGSSGAGKSTLLNVLCGLEKCSKGKVIYKGKELNNLNQKKLSNLRLNEFGFIFQDFYLVQTINVQDNIWLPSIVKAGKVDIQLYEEVIDDLGVRNRIAHYPNQLSGGEKQRVAIARSLVNKPNVIFADEPTGNLDSNNSNKVFELLIKSSKKYNQTLIYVTHDKAKANLADRKIIIKDGVLVEEY